MIGDHRHQPVAMRRDALFERHLPSVRKRLVHRMEADPGLGDPLGAQHLQFRENGVVADRDDVEREFVNPLRVEAEARQRLGGGEKRGREQPHLRIVIEREGAEKIGEQEIASAAPDEDDEMAAEPAPVGRREVRHVAQRRQRRPPHQPVAGERPRDRDEVVALGEQSLGPTLPVRRVQQPPAGKFMLRAARKTVPRELLASRVETVIVGAHQEESSHGLRL